MTKKLSHTLGVILLVALAFSVAMQAAPAHAVGSALTKAVGESLPDIAKIIGEKLGVEIPESAAGLLSQVGKSVTGEVTDSSKLAKYGLDNLTKGSKVTLENQGEDKLNVKDDASGKSTDIKMSDLLGVAAKLLK